MKGKIKYALAAVWLAVFVAAFAGEALAKPDWVSIKIQSWSVKEVNGSWKLRLAITHTNNSDNRVVTNIYDKYGTFTIKKQYLHNGKEATASCKMTLKSNKNNEVNLTPGESSTLNYELPIKTFDNGVKGLPVDLNEVNRMLRAGGWKLTWNYDCSMKSEPERRRRP